MTVHAVHDLSDLRDRFTVALAEGNGRYAEALIGDALAARVRAGDLQHEVIAPALTELGDLWARDLIGIIDQRLATELSERALAAIAGEASRPVIGPRARVLLATAAGEHHGLGLRMAGDALRAAGCDVLSLGLDVPPEQIAAAAVRHRVQAVGLSVILPGAAGEAVRCAHFLHAAGVPVVAGGACAGEALGQEPGVTVVTDVRDAAEAVAVLAQGRPERARHLTLV